MVVIYFFIGFLVVLSGIVVHFVSVVGSCNGFANRFFSQ